MLIRNQQTTFVVLALISQSLAKWQSADEECIGIPGGQQPEHIANSSVIFNEIITSVSTYLRQNNLTQIKIPDQSADFSFIGLKGRIAMTEGKLSGYDQMHAFGPAEVRYWNKGTTASAALRFADASQFIYKTKTDISKYSRIGTINASLQGLSMRINISVNVASLCKKVDSIKVENLDSIRVSVDSGWFLDSLTNTITNTVIWVYRNKLVPVIEQRAATAIQEFLDKIHLDDLLRPPASAIH